MFVSFVYTGSLIAFSHIPALSNFIYVNNGEAYFDLPVTYILSVTVLVCVVQLIAERFFSRRITKNTLSKCYIEFCGKSLECICLCDSGNLLTEKVSGLPVVIIESDLLCKIVDLSDKNIENYESLLLRMRFVPYKTADGKTGILKGFLPDVFKADGVKYKVIVASGNPKLDRNGVYHGISPIFERGKNDRVQTFGKIKRNTKNNNVYGGRL